MMKNRTALKFAPFKFSYCCIYMSNTFAIVNINLIWGQKWLDFLKLDQAKNGNLQNKKLKTLQFYPDYIIMILFVF